MKSLLLVLLMFLLASCASKSSASEEGPESSPTPENVKTEITNVNKTSDNSEESNINQAERNKLEAQNEKFRIIPDEFKQMDFRDFAYPLWGTNRTIKLNEGEFESPYDTKNCDNHFGGLNDVFYVDLDGDKRAEALVDVNYVSCGCGSCDGGSHLLYAYRLDHGKAKLFWTYSTGSYGYGGGLKSLIIRPSIITVEEFGIKHCSREEEKTDPTCGSKFQAKNIIRTRFVFSGKTFVRRSKEITKTGDLSVMNYRVKIDIDD